MEKWQRQVVESLEHAEAQELARILNQYFYQITEPTKDEADLLTHIFARLKEVCSPDEYLWVVFWTGAAWQMATTLR